MQTASKDEDSFYYKNSPEANEADPESYESYKDSHELESYDTDELPEDMETAEVSEQISSSMHYHFKVIKTEK